MKSRKLLQVVVVFVLCSAVSVLASEIKEAARPNHGTLAGGNVRYINKVLCVDGLKVFQTVTYASGTGVSNIQLYEEKNGKVVPVRCK